MVSDGRQRRNSAKAGSRRPAARKSEPRLKASRSSFFSSPTSHSVSRETPTKMSIGRPRSMRMCAIYSISVSISSRLTTATPARTAISLRERSGMNRTAIIANRTGANHSRAATHAGEIMVRSCSTSASRLAVISEIVTNCPDGSNASAATSPGDESINTVIPANSAGSTWRAITASASYRGSGS